MANLTLYVKVFIGPHNFMFRVNFWRCRCIHPLNFGKTITLVQRAGLNSVNKNGLSKNNAWYVKHRRRRIYSAAMQMSAWSHIFARLLHQPGKYISPPVTVIKKFKGFTNVPLSQQHAIQILRQVMLSKLTTTCGCSKQKRCLRICS